jgi:N-acetylglucosamine-6-phosphate deacetylase
MLLQAGTVVAGTAVLRPGWLEITGDRIGAVGGGDPPRAADVSYDDHTVVPGFVDMHVHGGGGGGFGGWVERAQSAVRFHLRHGTTSMLASLVTDSTDVLVQQVQNLESLIESGMLAGVHLEGPWLNARRAGAHRTVLLRDPTRDELDALLSAGRGSIRMITLAPERAGALDTIRQITAAGVIAAMGHTDASYDTAVRAINAGVTVGTHLFNAMRPIHHRNPGPIVALLEDERVTVELIGDGVHVHPSLYRLASVSGVGALALVTDATEAAGMPDGRHRLGDMDVDVRHGIATVAGTDTLAGGTGTMDGLFRFALRHSASAGDAALFEAVTHCSTAAAEAIGLADVGLLQAGYLADLVVLDRDHRPRAVLRRGEWVDGVKIGG